MQPITKSEMDFLIKNNLIKNKRGRYNGLITGSKKKHGNGKPRYIEEPIFEEMLRLQQKKKLK